MGEIIDFFIELLDGNIVDQLNFDNTRYSVVQEG